MSKSLQIHFYFGKDRGQDPPWCLQAECVLGSIDMTQSLWDEWAFEKQILVVGWHPNKTWRLRDLDLDVHFSYAKSNGRVVAYAYEHRLQDHRYL